MKLFGTSGVRGLTNIDITSQLAHDIATAYGSMLGEGSRALVGWDVRKGSEMLALAGASGFTSVGVDVDLAGCVSSPEMGSRMSSGDYRGGMMITGSHLPPERNGIIPLLADGSYLPDPDARVLEEMIDGRTAVRSGYGAVGTARRIKGVRQEYLDRMKRLLPPLSGLHIVSDPANGTGCGLTAGLLSGTPARVTEMNGSISSVPARPSEPRGGTLTVLSDMVVEMGADLGAGYDIDADRVVFMDERGEPVSEDVIGALVAENAVKRGEHMVTPVNSSGLLNVVAERNGFHLHRCRIGQPATQEAIKARGAVFACEESGKYYHSRHALWCDGPFTVGVVASILSATGEPLSGLISRFPRYHQVKRVLPLPSGTRGKILGKIAERMSELPSGGILDTTDGMKFTYPDGSWLLLRPSGTEPSMRVYSDAPDRERAEYLARAGDSFISKMLDDITVSR